MLQFPSPTKELDLAISLQLRRLVAESAFYAGKFRHLTSSQPMLSQSLRRLPTMTIHEIRENQANNPPLGTHSSVRSNEVSLIFASSGTTAPPHNVGVTASDWEGWVSVAARSFSIAGIKSGDVVLDALSFGMFAGGIPIVEALRQLGATIAPTGPIAPRRLVDIARAINANIILCTPSYLVGLMEQVDSSKFSVATLRCILLGTEPGGSIPQLRTIFEQYCGVPVKEALGNADLLPVYGATCGRSRGNHLSASDELILEIVEPDSGDVMPWVEGVEGELVATHLKRECTPVVRLRTGDLVQAFITPCPCGLRSPRLVCIGRIEDAAIASGRRVMPSEVQELLATFYPELTLTFEIDGSADAGALRLWAEFGLDALDIEHLKHRLVHAFNERFMVPVEVNLLPPNSLPRYNMKSQHKARR